MDTNTPVEKSSRKNGGSMICLGEVGVWGFYHLNTLKFAFSDKFFAYPETFYWGNTSFRFSMIENSAIDHYHMSMNRHSVQKLGFRK